MMEVKGMIIVEDEFTEKNAWNYSVPNKINPFCRRITREYALDLSKNSRGRLKAVLKSSQLLLSLGSFGCFIWLTMHGLQLTGDSPLSHLIFPILTKNDYK